MIDRLKRIPPMLLVVLAGFLMAVHGLYLLVELVWPGAGLGVTSLVGGVVLVVVGLVVDVD